MIDMLILFHEWPWILVMAHYLGVAGLRSSPKADIEIPCAAPLIVISLRSHNRISQPLLV